MPPGIALFLVAAGIIHFKQEDRVKKNPGHWQAGVPPTPEPPVSSRIEGTPPHPDIVTSSVSVLPCSSTTNTTTPHATGNVENSDADNPRMEEAEIDEMLRLLGRGEKSTEDGTETRKRVQTDRADNENSYIKRHLVSESSTKPKAPARPTNTKPPKPYVYRGSRIGKMLASSTYAQTVLPEESKRLAALEAFVARAAEVQLTDGDGEFDGQLVREIVGLREVRNPIDFHDAEAKRTLELAEELSRDLLAFQEKYGPGNTFVPTARRERTAREAAAVARHRMTGESDSEE